MGNVTRDPAEAYQFNMSREKERGRAGACVCVCVCVNRFNMRMLNFRGLRPSRKRMPTKLCVVVEAGSDQPAVPAE